MTKAQYIKQAQALGWKMAKVYTIREAYDFSLKLRDLRDKYRQSQGVYDTKAKRASTRLGLKSLAQGITRQLR